MKALQSWLSLSWENINDTLFPDLMCSCATSIHVFLWGFIVVKSSMTPTVILFILGICLISAHVALPMHLNQLASTSSLFPLKQEAGDEKESHICKMQPPALLIVSFSLEAKCDPTFYSSYQSLLTELLKNSSSGWCLVTLFASDIQDCKAELRHSSALSKIQTSEC